MFSVRYSRALTPALVECCWAPTWTRGLPWWAALGRILTLGLALSWATTRSPLVVNEVKETLLEVVLVVAALVWTCAGGCARGVAETSLDLLLSPAELAAVTW